LRKTYWYAYDGKGPGGLIAVPVERVKTINKLNRSGKKTVQLIELSEEDANKEKITNDYATGVGQDSLTRFDKPRDINRKNRRINQRRIRPENSAQNQQPIQNQRPDNRPNSNRNNRRNDQRSLGSKNQTENPKNPDQNS